MISRQSLQDFDDLMSHTALAPYVKSVSVSLDRLLWADDLDILRERHRKPDLGRPTGTAELGTTEGSEDAQIPSPGAL